MTKFAWAAARLAYSTRENGYTRYCKENVVHMRGEQDQ